MRKTISILIIGVFLLSILAIASCEKKGTSEDIDSGESNQSSESIKYRSASRTDSELKGELFTNSEDSNTVDDLEIEYEKQK